MPTRFCETKGFNPYRFFSRKHFHVFPKKITFFFTKNFSRFFRKIFWVWFTDKNTPPYKKPPPLIVHRNELRGGFLSVNRRRKIWGILSPQSDRKPFRNGLKKHSKASKNTVSDCILKGEIAKIFSPAAGYPYHQQYYLLSTSICSWKTRSYRYTREYTDWHSFADGRDAFLRP